MKRILTMIIVTLCIITVAAFASANGTLHKEKTPLNQTTKAKDITLTLDNYSIKNNDLMIEYTVKSEGENDLEPRGLLERPDVVIAGELEHAYSQTHKKIGEGKYTGSAKIKLPKNISNNFEVEFNTDAILNQEGQWTVNFKVK